MASKQPSPARPRRAKGETIPSFAHESNEAAHGVHEVPKLPHERDESAQVPAADVDPKIKRAYEGSQRGVLDTDRRSGYGLADDPPGTKKRRKTKVSGVE